MEIRSGKKEKKELHKYKKHRNTKKQGEKYKDLRYEEVENDNSHAKKLKHIHTKIRFS